MTKTAPWIGKESFAETFYGKSGNFTFVIYPQHGYWVAVAVETDGWGAITKTLDFSCSADTRADLKKILADHVRGW